MPRRPIARSRDRSEPILRFELRVDPFQMFASGIGAHLENAPDLGIALPIAETVQHLLFATRQGGTTRFQRIKTPGRTGEQQNELIELHPQSCDVPPPFDTDHFVRQFGLRHQRLPLRPEHPDKPLPEWSNMLQKDRARKNIAARWSESKHASMEWSHSDLERRSMQRD